MGKERVGQPGHQNLYRSSCRRSGWLWIRRHEHVGELHRILTEKVAEFRWGHALGGFVSRRYGTISIFFLSSLADAMRIANDNYHKTVKRSLLQGGTPSNPPSANVTNSTSLHTPAATSTSLPTPCTTPTLSYADGAKWHRRSRSKHSH